MKYVTMFALMSISVSVYAEDYIDVYGTHTSSAPVSEVGYGLNAVGVRYTHHFTQGLYGSLGLEFHDLKHAKPEVQGLDNPLARFEFGYRFNVGAD